MKEGVRGGEGAGHGLQAGDLELEGFALGLVGSAADGAERFLKKRSGGCFGHFPLKHVESRLFSCEHVDRGVQTGLFAGEVGVGDGAGARAKGLPGGANRGEAREERHEGDADDAHPFEAGFAEALGVLNGSF